VEIAFYSKKRVKNSSRVFTPAEIDILNSFRIVVLSKEMKFMSIAVSIKTSG
jgi:hypothetical protein